MNVSLPLFVADTMTSAQRQSNLLDEMEKTVSSYESKRSAPAPGTGAGDDDTYDESVLWVKFHFQDQVRRLKLSQKAYGELLAAVLPVVKGIDGSAGDAPLFLKYVDDEGELVNITSDGELSDAFAIAQKERRVLKIFASYTDPIDAPGSVATRSLDKVEVSCIEAVSCRGGRCTSRLLMRSYLNGLLARLCAVSALCRFQA